MTQETALNILKSGANVFLTGEPGSGKTHTVNLYVRWLREHNIDPAITASTGIAATHIGGMTIHSWSGIGIKTTLTKYDMRAIFMNERAVKRVKHAKILIIDEVSMLSATTLGMVDAVCREILANPKPFGGLQMVFVGDFFQLPPIVRRDEETTGQATLTGGAAPLFAYDSPAWKRADPTVCYLTEQHRQEDADFLGVLSAIRQNTFNDAHLRHLAARKILAINAPKDTPKLFSHNIDVDRINAQMLERLPGKPRTFMMESHGAPKIAETLIKNCLSPETLLLKPGAAVMFTKNNQKEGFVNGTLGTLTGFSAHTGNPIVETRHNGRIEVEPMEWAVEDGDRILARIKQMPLRLAWAITVHKSQGMSLDEAVMDLSGVFEFGQGYVALSRVRTLRGLHLLGWNERTFQVHPDVLLKDAAARAESDRATHTFSAMTADEIVTAREQFIRSCGGSLARNETYEQESNEAYGKEINEARKHGSNRAKQPTIMTTLALLKSGKTLAETAVARNLALTTIAGHLTELYAKKDITRADLLLFITPTVRDALPEIHAVFRDVGAERLTPVFEKMRGKYSFDDLRLARMLLEDGDTGTKA